MTTQTYAIPPPTKKEVFMYIFRFVDDPKKLICKMVGINLRQLKAMSAEQVIEEIFDNDRPVNGANEIDALLIIAGIFIQKIVFSGIRSSVRKNPALAEHFLKRTDDPTRGWMSLRDDLLAARDDAAIGDDKQT